MKYPSFSICIPNYNYGRYIGETIQSVLDQTYPYYEIIVADNASTDDSVEVVQSFNDERIRLIQNRYNIGFAPNLQRATMHARNEFINLLSSDDQMKPEALEEYARVLSELTEANQGVVLLSDAEGFDDAGAVTRIIRKAAHTFERVSLPPDVAAPADTSYTTYRGLDVLRDGLSRLDAVGFFCSTVYSRTLWEAVEGYSAVRTVGPDAHFMWKLLSRDPIVAYVHRPLFRYRDHLSDNRAAVQTTIQFQIDEYLNTMEFATEEFLSPVGLTRRDLVRAMVDRACLREALAQLGLGHYSFAFKLFAFALATYPGETLKTPKAYPLMVLLSLGPLSLLLARPLRRLYRRFMPRPLPFEPESGKEQS